MGEHTTNITALIAKTLPRFPPEGRAGHVQLEYRVAQKRHVYLVAPGVPMSEEGVAAHAKLCQERGWPPQEVLPLGQPLPLEKCDLVVVAAAVWVDTTPQGARHMVNPQTKEMVLQPRMGAHVMPGEFARVDLVQFMAHAEASLGEVPRIVRPGLQMVRD
jgi:hypothetical protein